MFCLASMFMRFSANDLAFGSYSLDYTVFDTVTPLLNFGLLLLIVDNYGGAPFPLRD